LHGLSFASKKMVIFALCDDFHHVVFGYGPVESMPECLAYDEAPWHMRSTYSIVNILKQLDALFSGDAPHHAVGALSI
jgi:hypothetical protein